MGHLTLWTLALTLLVAPSLHACTIFLLTDATHTFFCNNEDFSKPSTRIWFVPPGGSYHGCAYVGFDDGWAQGGVNTMGLAYDWVAGWNEIWKRNRRQQSVRGNSSERMLESCTTVDEAIAFYKKHWEPSFARSRIFIADRTGASVIIGASNGKLLVERSSQCRGFGYGRKIVEQAFVKNSDPTPENGFEILRLSRQAGEFATKYSTVWDLRSGVLFVQPPDDDLERDTHVRLDLTAELKKGGHYYDIPSLRDQISAEPLPLPPSMQRFYFDKLTAIENKNPEITRVVKTVVKDAARGKMRQQHYTPRFWQELFPQREAIKSDLQKLGRLTSATLVGRSGDETAPTYFYKLQFKNAILLQSYVFDSDRKLFFSKTEAFEFSTDALLAID